MWGWGIKGREKEPIESCAIHINPANDLYGITNPKRGDYVQIEWPRIPARIQAGPSYGRRRGGGIYRAGSQFTIRAPCLRSDFSRMSMRRNAEIRGPRARWLILGYIRCTLNYTGEWWWPSVYYYSPRSSYWRSDGLIEEWRALPVFAETFRATLNGVNCCILDLSVLYVSMREHLLYLLKQMQYGTWL